MGLLTANICGRMAKKADSKDGRLRHSVLMRKMSHHGVEIAGWQETHFRSEAEIQSQQFWASGQGYGMFASVADGNASAAVSWNLSG